MPDGSEHNEQHMRQLVSKGFCRMRVNKEYAITQRPIFQQDKLPAFCIAVTMRPRLARKSLMLLE